MIANYSHPRIDVELICNIKISIRILPVMPSDELQILSFETDTSFVNDIWEKKKLVLSFVIGITSIKLINLVLKELAFVDTEMVSVSLCVILQTVHIEKSCIAANIITFIYWLSSLQSQQKSLCVRCVTCDIIYASP